VKILDRALKAVEHCSNPEHQIQLLEVQNQGVSGDIDATVWGTIGSFEPHNLRVEPNFYGCDLDNGERAYIQKRTKMEPCNKREDTEIFVPISHRIADGPLYVNYGFSRYDDYEGTSFEMQRAINLVLEEEDRSGNLMLTEIAQLDSYKLRNGRELMDHTSENAHLVPGEVFENGLSGNAKDQLDEAGSLEVLVDSFVQSFDVEYEGTVNNEKKEWFEKKVIPRFKWYLVNFLNYLIERSENPTTTRTEVVQLLERFSKCGDQVKIYPSFGNVAGYSGVSGRKLEGRNITMDIYSMDERMVASTLVHEFIHLITLDNTASSEYDGGPEQSYVEGIAELAQMIVDPNARSSREDESYRNFTLLTAALFGKEDFWHGILDSNYFKQRFNIGDHILYPSRNRFEAETTSYRKYEQQVPSNFMARWSIDPNYKNDLQQVFFGNSAFVNLTKIKINEADQANMYGDNSFARLLVLRRILEANGISWRKFVDETYKEFGLPHIPTSGDYYH
jgi:hypothetical protein